MANHYRLHGQLDIESINTLDIDLVARSLVLHDERNQATGRWEGGIVQSPSTCPKYVSVSRYILCAESGKLRPTFMEEEL